MNLSNGDMFLSRSTVATKETIEFEGETYPLLKIEISNTSHRLIAGMLENLVCLELKRRGYEVYVGKQDDKEVDFVAIRREEKIYVQVTYQLASQATVEREFAPLLAINDHYPKYVVSMDSLWQDNVEGVRHRHIADFLLDDA